MTRLLTILTLTLSAVCCSTNYPDSDIEVITYYDKLNEIQNLADTIYNEFSNDSTVRYETYRFDTITIAYVSYMGDTLMAIGRKTNGVITALTEYFFSGQAKGKVSFGNNGRVDGPATYYYLDGRVRSTGQWSIGKRTGEWRAYNPIGQLETIEYYNDKGELEKKEKIKNYEQ